MSILPVDQGIEHSAAASFAPNPEYFDPENIVRARDRGRVQRGRVHVRRARHRCARKYAHKIPFIVKINHNELLTLSEQVRPDHVRHRAAGLRHRRGRPSARRSTSDPTSRPARSTRSRRVRAGPPARACSRCCGATCATPRSSRATSTTTSSADLTGQANHLGVTIEADIIKQKLPENNGGYNALKGYGKTVELVYDTLTTDQPDRPVPLPGGELLHGPRRADQQRRRVVGRSPTWPKPSAPR